MCWYMKIKMINQSITQLLAQMIGRVLPVETWSWEANYELTVAMPGLLHSRERPGRCVS